MFDSEESEEDLVFPRKKNPYFSSFDILKKVKNISKGSFGIVDLYQNEVSRELFAVKRLEFKGRYDEFGIKELRREMDLLYKIDNPHIVKMYDHFESENKYLHLVMEFVDGRDLCAGFLTPKVELPKQDVCRIIHEICDGLSYLHSMNILHRDLKLENVMIQTSTNTVKIIDLGESNYFGENLIRKTYRGTQMYFCPEIANSDEQDDKVDVWCLGVILFELLFLEAPFKGKIFTKGVDKVLLENIRVN